MRFDVLTLFPNMFDAVLGDSIIGRAQKAGILKINCINIRDFSEDKHKRVDDYPYGGGRGMIMQPQPIYNAYKSIEWKDKKPLVIYLSPQGKVFDQSFARELSKQEHIVLICGHYEGVDERVIEEIVDIEVSIGNFILTGGEIPAMAVIDAVSRFVPGVLPSEEAFLDESLTDGLLEYPQYTRPPEFLGRKVPEVLLSGHHKNIENWRCKKSIKRTKEKRPDLFEKIKGVEDDKK